MTTCSMASRPKTVASTCRSFRPRNPHIAGVVIVKIMAAADCDLGLRLRRQVVNAAAIRSAVDQVLEAWWLRECSGLDWLLRDAGAAFDEQRGGVARSG